MQDGNFVQNPLVLLVTAFLAVVALFVVLIVLARRAVARAHAQAVAEGRQVQQLPSSGKPAGIEIHPLTGNAVLSGGTIDVMNRTQ